MYRWYARMAEEPTGSLVCECVKMWRFSRDWSSLLPRGVDTIYNMIHTQTQIPTHKKKKRKVQLKHLQSRHVRENNKSVRMLQLNSPSPEVVILLYKRLQLQKMRQGDGRLLQVRAKACNKQYKGKKNVFQWLDQSTALKLFFINPKQQIRERGVWTQGAHLHYLEAFIWQCHLLGKKKWDRVMTEWLFGENFLFVFCLVATTNISTVDCQQNLWRVFEMVLSCSVG